MPHLIQNALYIPEDDFYLVSQSSDDIQVHKFSDGKIIAIQGGLEFAQRVPILLFSDLLDQGRIEEWSLSNEDSAELVSRRMLHLVGGKWRLVNQI